MTEPPPHCLLCGSSETRSGAVFSAGYRVWYCRHCEFCWVDRRDLERIDLSSIYQQYPYNESIRSSFGRMHELYHSGFHTRVLRHYSEMDLKNLSFLDIGCANGEYLAVASELGFQNVAGVEIDRVAASHASQYGQIVEDVTSFDREFDIVQIKNVLTNIANLHEFLINCLSRLKPGGTLFLDVLNHAGLTSVVRKVRHRLGDDALRYGTLRPPAVINGFNKKNIALLLATKGLQSLDVRDSYLGSTQVPYANIRLVKLAGMAGQALGMGTMLLVDATKATQDEA